ncbi:MAG: hypothetical protein F4051_10000 [Boseongicola sp. SB0670_bin_30]|nr:hypothetical protein [Boseongicola sp. SB0670_bin_30]
MNRLGLDASLLAIPEQLRTPLIAQFEEALAAYAAGDWEKVGIKAGKFCEVAYRICEGYVIGTYASEPSKPDNMLRDCQQLEKFNKTKGRSLCIQVPRILIGLYELRNNRAIGHVGGEIDPNHMDAELFLRGMKWVVGEFIRFFSKLPEDDSRAVVEAVTARTHHIVWKHGDVRRVLDPSKSTADKILILAYAAREGVSVTDLMKWSEYANASRLRRQILRRLHKRALIHFDEKADSVRLLPPGQMYVESGGLLSPS